MDKHQKDMNGNHKTATHAKDDNSMMKGDKATDMKADDKKSGAMKTEDKKTSSTHAK